MKLRLALNSNQRFLGGAIAIASTILFTYSSLRHFLLRSTAYDLGLFDSALYRLSRGAPPLDTIHNLHILADHAAWIFYPIAVLYWLTPNVHWLFGLQALGLAFGAWPVWWLAYHHHHLNQALSRTMVVVYLLYPVLFNVNLFDFHPDIFAPTLLLFAVIAVYQRRHGLFIFILMLLCGCKAIFSLTIMGLGLWLWVGERKHRYGAIALLIGTGWFILANKWIIPTLSGIEVTGVGRYAFLGDSLNEIILNLFRKPHIVIQHLATFENVRYLVLLTLPLMWGLSWQFLTPMIATTPSLGLNLLTTFSAQKDLNHQYSLPIIPFLILAVLAALAHRKTWLRRPRWILTWSLICFLILGRAEYFMLRYFDEGFNTVWASKEALVIMNETESVLVPAHILPQVSHRLESVRMILPGVEKSNLSLYQNVLIDLDFPDIHTPFETNKELLTRLDNEPAFKLVFERDNVFLFEKVLE